ncbi:MAG: hypothetical protein ACTSPA_02095 [Promethearchaeota archaeon]
MEFEQFLENNVEKSNARIKKLHGLAKKIWNRQKMTPIDLQNKCLDTWDKMSRDLDCKILPLVQVNEDRPITNLIFGSGSFTTGKFQAEQYNVVKSYCSEPPIILQGIVSNKSKNHKCNALDVSNQLSVPLIEFDFIDWYHENIDKHEQNPIRATKYLFGDNEEKHSLTEIARRFSIRQNRFHKILGEEIAQTTKTQTDIVSARGYNFQFCSSIFAHQPNHMPHINDTHPADLSYIDSVSKKKLYAGWQSGAIELMMKDKIHETYRGSFIEVEYMDNYNQINTLDEGVLLGLGNGITPESDMTLTSTQIQSAMKIMDDNFFCTLEPTGLILLWGVTDKPIPVIYKSKEGRIVIVKQRAVFVGNKFHSGLNAWGSILDDDIKELHDFLFP